MNQVEGQFAIQELGTFEAPWALAVLPQGQLLITEKAGKLKLRAADGSVRDVPLPFTVDFGGQGGNDDGNGFHFFAFLRCLAARRCLATLLLRAARRAWATPLRRLGTGKPISAIGAGVGTI